MAVDEDEMYLCTPGMNSQYTRKMNRRRSSQREAVLVNGVVLTGVAAMRRMIDEVNTSTLLTTLCSYCQPCSYAASVVCKVYVSAVGRSAGALATVASSPFDSRIESLSGLLGGVYLPFEHSDGGGSLRGGMFTQFATQADSLDATGGRMMQFPSKRA